MCLFYITFYLQTLYNNMGYDMKIKMKVATRIIYICALVYTVLFSVGYSALSANTSISGNARYDARKNIRVTSIALQGTTNSGVESFNPNYTWNTTTSGVNLPNIGSTVSYTVTVRNSSSSLYAMKLSLGSTSNSSISYAASNLPANNLVPANSTVTFTITIKYNTSTLPSTKTGTVVVNYFFGTPTATFDIGRNVNSKMKKFVNSSATYATVDSTITKIERFTGSPAASNLTDNNIVSSTDSLVPIYMWYNSGSTTIYWYCAINSVYYNANSNHFYQRLNALNSISNINDISPINTTSMNSMFYSTGASSSSFTLNLGSNFNTSNVTDMNSMFYCTGQNSPVFTLNLGSNFDTSKVTDMTNMFNATGYASTSFTLNLGNKFNSSRVGSMYGMFMNCGYTNTQFTLTTGSKFYPEGTNMSHMFYATGHNSTIFTLDARIISFDACTDTSYMFYETGYSNTSFTLQLSSPYTINVTDMSYMFYKTGYSSTVFTLDIGSTTTNLDTDNVTNMEHMFHDMGHSSTVITLNLGPYFDTSKVTNMAYMFCGVGGNSASFTLTLGNYFDTSNVTDMTSMFNGTGYGNNSFTLNLGNKFNTSKVTSMQNMFRKYKGTVLDLSRFKTTSVTNMAGMFNICPNLTTIYATPEFIVTQVTSSTDMFTGSTNIVGGAGTVFSSSYTDKTRAKIDGGTSNPGYFSQRSYYLDLNGRLDGTDSGNITGYGTCNVKINGSTVATGITDYYTAWPTGTTYAITCTANSGYTYGGVANGSLSGTIAYSNTSVRVIFNTDLSVPKSFSYTGGVQSYSIPANGLYKLEVWGAKGGDSGVSGKGGGQGGHSVGYKVLNKGDTLYVVVGGAGVNGAGSGGYNGGGYSSNLNLTVYGSGGGATHIARRTGTISSIGSANIGDILIVAGGGGGGGEYNSGQKGGPGGAGGGTTGSDGGGNGDGHGGTQTSGGTGEGSGRDGSFGQGGNGASGGSGGGGGLYGGGSGKSHGCPGGGGSGYIGGVPSISHGGTTYSPSTSNGGNNGNGKATITYVSS